MEELSDYTKEIILENCQKVWRHEKYDGSTDHEHCDICWHKIMVSSNPMVGEGYKDEFGDWICCECYEKFIRGYSPKE